VIDVKFDPVSRYIMVEYHAESVDFPKALALPCILLFDNKTGREYSFLFWSNVKSIIAMKRPHRLKDP
jgi:hypothetical protein